jgi:hypothetical protein
MRYMLLIYSQRQPEMSERNYMGHLSLMREAADKRVFVAAEPLAPASKSTSVQVVNGKALVTDGPFTETKEQLAGYYILDCKDLKEAIEWAARIPQACQGGDGRVEIRELPGIPKEYETTAKRTGAA